MPKSSASCSLASTSVPPHVLTWLNTKKQREKPSCVNATSFYVKETQLSRDDITTTMSSIGRRTSTAPTDTASICSTQSTHEVAQTLEQRASWPGSTGVSFPCDVEISDLPGNMTVPYTLGSPRRRHDNSYYAKQHKMHKLASKTVIPRDSDRLTQWKPFSSDIHQHNETARTSFSSSYVNHEDCHSFEHASVDDVDARSLYRTGGASSVSSRSQSSSQGHRSNSDSSSNHYCPSYLHYRQHSRSSTCSRDSQESNRSYSSSLSRCSESSTKSNKASLFPERPVGKRPVARLVKVQSSDGQCRYELQTAAVGP